MPSSNLVRRAAIALAAGAVCAAAHAEDLVAIGPTLLGGQSLIGLNSNAPALPTYSRVITGLEDGDRIRAIDFRPSNGVLYAVASRRGSDEARLYTLNRATGHATPLDGVITPALQLTSRANVGMDFNPVVDLIRVITTDNRNLVINPDTGELVAVATDVFYAAGDVHEGVNPAVGDIAYDRNTPCPSATQQYGIDVNLNILVTVANSAGTLETVGFLDVDAPLGLSRRVIDVAGMDISGETGRTYALMTAELLGVLGLPIDVPLQSLYTIDLTSGKATSVGLAGTGLLDLDALAVISDDLSSEGCCPSRANLDGDGALTIFDFLLFQNLFDAGDPAADFNFDGEINIFDFLEYQNVFERGCFG